MIQASSFRNNLLVVLVGLLLFVPFLGAVHLFDWDEINFAECAREMLESNNYLWLQINFKPFCEKPPFFIWLQTLSMKTFGVNEFAARFPNAICGIITLLLVFKIGEKLFNQRFGILWAACFVCSILPQLYFKSGIIDPWYNLFIFYSVYRFYLFIISEKNGNQKIFHLLISAVSLGLAILTKGPVAAIIFFICFLIYFILKWKIEFRLSHFIIFIFTTSLIGAIWFSILFFTGKKQVLEDFLSYQFHLFHAEDSGHGGPFYYHLLVLLFGCFPASIFAFKASTVIVFIVM